MNRIESGFFWTGILYLLPRLIKAVVSGLGTFLVWFILAAFVGMFINGFSGFNEPQKGPVTYDQVEVYATGTLDNIEVSVRNLNPDHEIKRLDMDCDKANIFIRHIAPGETKHHSAYTPNIARGQIQCVFLRVHS